MRAVFCTIKRCSRSVLYYRRNACCYLGSAYRLANDTRLNTSHTQARFLLQFSYSSTQILITPLDLGSRKKTCYELPLRPFRRPHDMLYRHYLATLRVCSCGVYEQTRVTRPWRRGSSFHAGLNARKSAYPFHSLLSLWEDVLSTTSPSEYPRFGTTCS
ncbi:hypothetical protein BDZ89DRAFT_326063 [Hymenopellis radicata]|nr:hypothetical protein BDZ89DRAFT_326063 [Hymenopellis radicata]